MQYAIVTGGTKGIGKGIIAALLKRNYFVYTNYAFDDTAAIESEAYFKSINSNVRVIKADQSNQEEFDKFIQLVKAEVPHINCLILNTGATIRKSIEETSNEDWEKIMQINLNSHFYMIRDLKPLIHENGRIIFMGSLLGNNAHATSLAYGVTKAAIHALSRNLVKYFEGTNTTVNTIAPGFVETEWQKDKPLEIRNNIYAKSAIKRFAEVEEIVSACMFIIDNGFVNGTVIEVTGGYSYK
ncbi:SDR family oxidoreductase [Bacteroidales bacterium OttesenSCG-928-I14]|nr:SDR family oxidoreductase [Bacteroidales bacterium OttesenSCG-928-I14]